MILPQLTQQNFVIYMYCILICIIIIIIIYKLYMKDYNSDNYIEENFESSLKKLKIKSKSNNNKNNKNNNNNNTSTKSNFEDLKNIYPKSILALKSTKTNTTFEDLLKATEKMNPDKYSIANMSKSLSEYKNSFNKEKFSNNSKNTAESFEKFALYKQKFMEIFL